MGYNNSEWFFAQLSWSICICSCGKSRLVWPTLLITSPLKSGP